MSQQTRRRKMRAKRRADRGSSEEGLSVQRHRHLAKSPFELTRPPKSRGHKCVDKIQIFQYPNGVVIYGVGPKWQLRGKRNVSDRSNHIPFGEYFSNVNGKGDCGWWFDNRIAPHLGMDEFADRVVKMVNNFQWG